MRKFTLYQASRFTNISRYKLEQAINDGVLSCNEGKGNIKCYIREDDLMKFLDQHADQYRRFTLPSEKSTVFISEEIKDHISKELHDQLINEKNRIISLLEFQNKQLMPEYNTNKNLKSVKIQELKSIAEAAINELPNEKKSLQSKLKSKLVNLEIG